MITVKKYNKKLQKEWDQFIVSSNNGTIFQTQKFLSYHNNKKFKHFSLIVNHNNSPIAAIPGVVMQNKGKKKFYSHPGASFGGIVLKKNLSFALINKIIIAVEEYLKASSFNNIFLINTPIIYFDTQDFSLDYLLNWHQYKQKEIYISHAVNIRRCTCIADLLSKRKKRYINNDYGLNQFSFKKSTSFQTFYNILYQSKLQYKTKPTHSLKELKKLQSLCSDEIDLLITKDKNRIVGGSLIFHTNKKVSLIFYNVVKRKFRNTQLATLQLYQSMKIIKQRGQHYVDFGVSHTPEATNPFSPKWSLIKFKEQFGSSGVTRQSYIKDL